MARAADPARARAAATRVVTRLRAAGHTAYFAGGCVRDEILGLHPADYDVATDAPPTRVRSLFPRTAAVGAAFGVVLVHEPGGPDGPGVSVEVATFRADGAYTDARRPDSVTFSDAPTDASRRDFTINALFLDPVAPADDPAKGVIDFVGGLADLEAGLVRAVGDPDRRLAEDHLRALRAVRFTARFGFTLDPATGAAVARRAAGLKGVSRERIGEELRRMFTHPTRGIAVRLMQSLTLDAAVLNEASLVAEPLRLSALEQADFPQALAAWALDRHAAGGEGPTRYQGKPWGMLVGRWRRALCLSNAETERLTRILSAHAHIEGLWPGPGVAWRKRSAAGPGFVEALALWGVVNPEKAAAVGTEVTALEATAGGLAPGPFLTGDDLVRSGVAPGPGFRRVLEAVYDAQLEGRVRNSSEALELALSMGV